MGWASSYIEQLALGNRVSFRPKGNSMHGKIKSGQLVTVRPITQNDKLQVGNIVLCKVKGREYLHLISAIKANRYQISNNLNHVNGWIGRNQIFGILVRVEP